MKFFFNQTIIAMKSQVLLIITTVISHSVTNEEISGLEGSVILTFTYVVNASKYTNIKKDYTYTYILLLCILCKDAIIVLKKRLVCWTLLCIHIISYLGPNHLHTKFFDGRYLSRHKLSFFI